MYWIDTGNDSGAEEAHLSHSSPTPCDVVVFGGTGDLAMRKLLPALFHRDRDAQLGDGSRIMAVSRAGLDDAGYRDKVASELRRSAPEASAAERERFLARLFHVT